MKTLIAIYFVILTCDDLPSQSSGFSPGIPKDICAQTLHSSGDTDCAAAAAGATPNFSSCDTDPTSTSASNGIVRLSLFSNKPCKVINTTRFWKTRTFSVHKLLEARAQFSAGISFSTQDECVCTEALMPQRNGKSIADIISSDIPSEKSPVLAGVLSMFLPGTGQAYNGQWIKAGIQWILIAASLYMVVADVNFESEGEPLPPLTVAGLATGGATWLWSVIDAPVSANQINNERNRTLRMQRLSRGAGIMIRF